MLKNYYILNKFLIITVSAKFYSIQTERNLFVTEKNPKKYEALEMKLRNVFSSKLYMNN